MKKNIRLWILVVTFILTAPLSWAATITFSPTNQTVGVGDQVFLDINISGLGDGTAPSLGVFDLDVSYDGHLLGFNSVIFGDLNIGDQLDFSGYGADYDITTYQGGIRLYGLSYDTPDTLDTLQADSFTMARIGFQTLNLGTSGLDLAVNILGDANGDALQADATPSGHIQATPAPPALLLLGTGLVGAWTGTGRRKQLKRC